MTWNSSHTGGVFTHNFTTPNVKTLSLAFRKSIVGKSTPSSNTVSVSEITLTNTLHGGAIECSECALGGTAKGYVVMMMKLLCSQWCRLGLLWSATTIPLDGDFGYHLKWIKDLTYYNITSCHTCLFSLTKLVIILPLPHHTNIMMLYSLANVEYSYYHPQVLVTLRSIHFTHSSTVDVIAVKRGRLSSQITQPMRKHVVNVSLII